MQTIKLSKDHTFRGIGFDDVASEVIEMAKRRNVTIEFYFATKMFTATPTSTLESLSKEFDMAFTTLDIHSAKQDW